MIIAEKYNLKEFKVSYVSKQYLNWFKDPDVKNFISFKCKNLRELKKDVSKRLKEKNSIFFGIFSKKKHIGNIFVNKINKKKKQAQLGILIGDKNYRSRGVGYISILSVIKWLKKNYGIDEVFLGLSKKNIPALNLYKKIGFKKIKEKKKSQTIGMSYNYLANKFILGTAQFGSDYGVTNSKVLSNKNVKKILKYAKTIGINHLDLAENYNFNWNNIKYNKFIFDTKININKKNQNLQNLEENFYKIKKNKKLFLDTVYIHNPQKIFSSEGKKLIKILNQFKRKKLIKKIGISAYNPNVLIKIINRFKVDVVQIPYNVLDRRFEKHFSYIKKQKILIYARSIFLQGVLLSKKTKFSEYRELINFFKLSKKIKQKELDLCIDFVSSNNFIDKIIFGVSSVNHLKLLIKSRINQTINYPKNLISKNVKLIDPRNWN